MYQRFQVIIIRSIVLFISLILITYFAFSRVNAWTNTDTPVSIATFGGFTANGMTQVPSNIKRDSVGNFYVASFNGFNIQKFDSTGNFIFKVGSAGSGDGQFSRAIYGVAIDSDDSFYVVDNRNSRVQKFDSNGNFLLKWGTSGSGDGQFNSPTGIVIDSDGNVYVSELSAHRIQKFDSQGNFISKWTNAVGTASGYWISY
jgi:sugar lactone lactonase YvrE